jgi:hypothetical protein
MRLGVGIHGLAAQRANWKLVHIKQQSKWSQW